MRAMILAAGKGTRLRPLTDTVPKPLLEVAGRPMIAFPLRLLRDAGIQEVVINLHHLGGQIRAALGDGSAYGMQIFYSEEEPILDTGGGIAAARHHLASDTFVVLNSDTFMDIRLLDVIAAHRGSGALVSMVLRTDPDALRHDDIGIDAGQRVWRIRGHQVGGPAQLTRCMYAGIMIFEPRIFDYLPDAVYSITRDVLPRLLDAGEQLGGYLQHGYWRVLDTHGDLDAGRREIAARLGGNDSA